MKILFVIENYLPHIGGVEVVFRNLAEELAKRGHTATIVTHRLPGTAAEETINGVKVKRVSCFGSRYLFTFFSIPAAVAAAKNADIVHTTTFNGFFPAWVAAKLAGKPLIATIHEVWLGKWREYGGMSWATAPLYEIFERLLIYSLPSVDKYVAVSNSTLQQLLKVGKKNSATIYNGLDYSHFNPKKHNGKKIRQKYGLQKDYALLVYGRPGSSKGIEYAITAMKEIKQRIPNAKMMLMLSRGQQYRKKYAELMKLAEKLDLGKAIIEAGPARYNELPDYIASADCVIVPSLSEGFGYTAAEAAAMGKPIIASSTTSLPEVVSGKHILVKPKDSHEIAAAVDNMRNGKCRRTPLRKFTIEQNVSGYLKAYNELLNRRPAANTRQHDNCSGSS